MSRENAYTDERGMDDFINDVSKILLIDGLHPHTRRSILYKAIQDFSKLQKNNQDYQYWSKKAWAFCETKGCIPSGKLAFEHPVPISEITDVLTPYSWVDPKTDASITEWKVKLEYAFRKLVVVCWVCDDENKQLDEFFRYKMPDGSKLNWTNDNIWARYECINQPILRRDGTSAPLWKRCKKENI